jgi:hypothetical protein
VTANVLVVVAIDSKHERDTAPTPKNAEWSTPEEIAAALTYYQHHQVEIDRFIAQNADAAEA